MDKIISMKRVATALTFWRFPFCVLILCLVGIINVLAASQERPTDEILKTRPDIEERAHERSEETRTERIATRNAERNFRVHHSRKKEITQPSAKFEDLEDKPNKQRKATRTERRAYGFHEEIHHPRHAESRPSHGCQNEGSPDELRKCEEALKKLQGKK